MGFQPPIPIIDITPLRDNSDPITTARALHAASSGPGFIYINGHGIADDIIGCARETALKFFRLPDERKSLVGVAESHRGWIKSGSAKMADNARPDLKESFVWGHEDDAIGGGLTLDHSLRGTNKWPDLPEMKQVCVSYFEAVHEVAEHLMRGFALGLHLPADAFLKTSDRPISRCSFVYYPPQSIEHEGDQFGVAPHTDFGALTVLCQDHLGGLEIETVDGQWIAAPPIDGTLVVNVGDLLARWTDDAYRSTPHRVVNRSGKERLSLVLAYDPNPETIIDSRHVFGAGHEAKYDPTTCGDYLTWRFAKAFAHKAAN
ncbi:MAG: isopenicillin N synthase family dioxygenase [Hyphomicrobiaceae bacterium]